MRNVQLSNNAENFIAYEKFKAGDVAVYIKRNKQYISCLLYTSPSPRDQRGSRMPSSA